MRPSSDDKSSREDPKVSGTKKTKRILNVPLLVVTLLAAAVLGPAAYAWHAYQVSRTSEAFLRRADSLEAEEDWAGAATYLFRYLQLHPGKADVQVRLAEVFDKGAQDPRSKLRAIDLYYQALGALEALEAPEALETASADQKHDLRCRLAELLIEIGELFLRIDQPVKGRFSLAKAEAIKLLEADDVDPEGRRLLALALVGELRSGALAAKRESGMHVVEKLEDALYVRPNQGNVQLSHALARIYRDIDLLPNEQFLEILRPVYRSKDEPLDDALSGIQARIERAQEKPLREELATISARLTADEGQDAQPPAGKLSLVLADSCGEKPQLSADDRRVALKVVRELLADDVMDKMVAADPETPEALLVRYGYRMQHGLPGAKDDLEAALKHGPDEPAVLLTAAEHARREAATIQQEDGLSEQARARYEEACRHYEHATEVAPSDGRGYLGLGTAYVAQGEVSRAVEAWQRGLEAVGEQSLELNTRLAEALVSLGQLDQAGSKLDALDRAIEERTPWETRANRLAQNRLRDLLRGKWLLAKREHTEAIPLLKRVATGGRGSTAEAVQAYQACLYLATAYAALGQLDQVAPRYEEAASLQPQAAQPRFAAAAAWMTVGRPDRAIPQYERGLTLADSPEMRYRLALARFQRQARLPKGERNWGRFSKALAEAKDLKSQDKLAEAWRVDLLEADYAVMRAKEDGQPDEGVRKAKVLLGKVENEHPDSLALLRILILAYERLESPADADRALETFGKLVDSPEKAAAHCVLKSTLFFARKQYQEARETLQDGLKTLPANLHPVLQQGLMRVALAEGKLEEVQQQLLRVHQTNPTNAAAVRQLAELALERNNLKDAARWETKLREFEGPDGSYWRYVRARRLMGQAKNAKDPAFTEAAELQADLQARRPAWSRVHSLGGLIFERQGKFEQAIQAYEQAIRLGEQRVKVYERLAALLYRAQRFDEADRYLSRLKEQAPASQSLSSLEISVAAGLGQLDRAVEAARRGVETRPNDPIARIWLGQMLLLANEQLEEAEAAFEQAVELAPSDPRPYNALFSFYLRTQKPKRAEETLQRLAQEAQLSDAQRAFILAQGYEMLGDREKAETAYQEAQQLDQKSVAILKRQANFLMRTDPAEAERVWRRVRALAPQDGAARQTLATILAARGGDEEWQEVEELLEGEDVSTSDRRLEAILLVRRGGPGNRREAKDLLVKLVADPETTAPGDRLLLARLYEAENSLEAARQQYMSLVSRADPNASHLAAYVDFLLRYSSADQATAWLTRLEALTPDNLGTMGLRARWLRARGQTSKIERLVEDLAAKLLKKLDDNEAQEAQLALAVGNLYTALDLHEAAQRWYRRLLKLVPERYEPLAMSLARQGRMNEAIQLCARAAESESSLQPVIVLTLVLTSGQPKAEDFELAERLLAEALESDKDNPALISAVAAYVELLLRSDSADQATAWLTRLEELAPDNLGTMGLRARWMRARGQTSKIEPLVEDLAAKLLKKLGDNEAQEAQLASAVGNLYTAVDLHQAAERWYRLVPERYEPLAMSLGRQGRMNEAIKLCTKAAELESSLQPVIVLTSVLMSGQPRAEDFKLAEPLLAEALKSHKDNPALISAVANVRVVQGQTAEAIQLYRQVLQLRPEDALALNNLATLLAEQPETREEALRCIEQAIEIAGREPPLLDTKGTILLSEDTLSEDDLHEALTCLKEAAATPNADPRFHFHLAVAYDRANEADKAGEAFAKALDGDVKGQILTETDRKWLAELEQKYSQ